MRLNNCKLGQSPDNNIRDLIELYGLQIEIHLHSKFKWKIAVIGEFNIFSKLPDMPYPFIKRF